MWCHALCATVAAMLLCDVAAAQETQVTSQETPQSEAPQPFTDVVVVTASARRSNWSAHPSQSRSFPPTPSRGHRRAIFQIACLGSWRQCHTDLGTRLQCDQPRRDKNDCQHSTRAHRRSEYLSGLLGIVLWDALPIESDEIRQIEVIRGPASAVWGANAMDGVVNILTKSPRDIVGSSVSIGSGLFDRDGGTAA